MFQTFWNWRTLLALVAMIIVTGTIFYSKYLSEKIDREEKVKVTAFAESLKIKALSNDENVIRFTNQIAVDNTEIPIIETDEKDNPSGIYANLDSLKVANDTQYLRKMVAEFKSIHDPVRVEITNEPVTYNKYYYGNTRLQQEVRYYPLVQLLIVALFILVTILALRSSYRSSQNQVWAGMAKETAHQLGTPVSSLEGWVEMMKQDPNNEKIVSELEKDVNRLRLVSDRFGKIGSIPHLEERDIIGQVREMMEYMKKRAAGKVQFSLNTHGESRLIAPISGPLFDWVIENLLKNALDALEGKGAIHVDIHKHHQDIQIDVSDTGKGISKQHVARIFKPGFTTKKRGWGLGLSLSKRIMEQYHKGEIFVKSSEPGKGTTFRIVLKAANP
ncbi:MAG: HAMP domain-containing histidine kinase [Chitinophagaceae bacterium]|nr:HAMP domain-containing histidine kinase [Chitinophagaceae bacterium]MBN8668264.1 HAMP domain-containing histidine kinase [Chitinophagales bacterium]